MKPFLGTVLKKVDNSASDPTMTTFAKTKVILTKAILPAVTETRSYIPNPFLLKADNSC